MKMLGFKAVVNKEDFKSIIFFGKGFCSEIRLVFSKKGFVSFTDMDPANVALISAKIPYKSDEFFDFEVGVNINSVNEAIKDVSCEELIITFCKEDDYDFIRLETDRGFFNIRTYDYDTKAKIPSELKFVHKVIVDKKDFFNAVIDSDKVAESISLFTKGVWLKAKARGDLHTFESKSLGMIKEESSCCSKFSIAYLKKLIDPKAFFGIKKITLSLGNDYVLLLESDNDKLMILAPRIDSD